MLGDNQVEFTEVWHSHVGETVDSETMCSGPYNLFGNSDNISIPPLYSLEKCPTAINVHRVVFLVLKFFAILEGHFESETSGG